MECWFRREWESDKWRRIWSQIFGFDNWHLKWKYQINYINTKIWTPIISSRSIQNCILTETLNQVCVGRLPYFNQLHVESSPLGHVQSQQTWFNEKNSVDAKPFIYALQWRRNYRNECVRARSLNERTCFIIIYVDLLILCRDVSESSWRRCRLSPARG